MHRWVAQGHAKHAEEWWVLWLGAGKVLSLGDVKKIEKGSRKTIYLLRYFFDEPHTCYATLLEMMN